jgi:hypothetical protein
VILLLPAGVQIETPSGGSGLCAVKHFYQLAMFFVWTEIVILHTEVLRFSVTWKIVSRSLFLDLFMWNKLAVDISFTIFAFKLALLQLSRNESPFRFIGILLNGPQLQPPYVLGSASSTVRLS